MRVRELTGVHSKRNEPRANVIVKSIKSLLEDC